MKEGEWVSGVYNKSKYNGFILGVGINSLLIQTTNMSEQKVLTVHKKDVVNINEPMLNPDELDYLIDYALSVRDEKWFRELCYEKSLWRIPSDIL